MKIKMKMVTCQHESKYGVDSHTRFVKKNESVDDVIESIKKECDFNESKYGEYFDSNVEELIIDTDDFEKV